MRKYSVKRALLLIGILIICVSGCGKKQELEVVETETNVITPESEEGKKHKIEISKDKTGQIIEVIKDEIISHTTISEGDIFCFGTNGMGGSVGSCYGAVIKETTDEILFEVSWKGTNLLDIQIMSYDTGKLYKTDRIENNSATFYMESLGAGTYDIWVVADETSSFSCKQIDIATGEEEDIGLIKVSREENELKLAGVKNNKDLNEEEKAKYKNIFIEKLKLYTEEIPIEIVTNYFDNSEVGAFVVTLDKEDFVYYYWFANGVTYDEVQKKEQEEIEQFVVTEDTIEVVKEYLSESDGIPSKLWYVTEKSSINVDDDYMVYIEETVLDNNIKCVNITKFESNYNYWNCFYTVINGIPTEILKVHNAQVQEDGTVKSSYAVHTVDEETATYNGFEITDEIWQYESGKFVCIDSHTYREE